MKNPRDAPAPVVSTSSTETSADQDKIDRDGLIVVDWSGKDDPSNPKNWTYAQKWTATALISIFTMLSPATSSMIAPAANRVAQDLGATSSIFQPLLTSIFILAYAFGPLFFGPLSQIFGRARVVQVGNLFYLLFNLLCAWAKTPGQMLAFRFLAGLGGSAPLAIGGGVINDCWSVEQRGRAVTLYSLAPLLGPILGPVAGAWITVTTTWQWVFWSTSIFDVVVQVIAVIWLKETCAPVILSRRAQALRKALPLSERARVITVFQKNSPQKPPVLRQLMYPITLMVTEPIAQLVGIYLAYIYGELPCLYSFPKLIARTGGLVYLLLTSIPEIYVSIYRQNIGIAGLHYFSIGLGLYTGAQICNIVLDKIHGFLTARNNGKGRPEFRIPVMLPATLLVPTGLLITGWTSRRNVHWIVPDIGLFITGTGIAINYQAIQTYIIDTYTVRAAPALGGLSLLRSLVGFALPLCSPAMYRNLGYGVGDTVLAACAVGLGCPMAILLWFFGQRLRRRSETAAHD